MHLRTICVLVALIIAAATLAVAGTTGKIVGELKDAKTGEPIIGASVKIEGTTMGAASNLDGYYVILNVPPGRYALGFSAVGYNKKQVTNVSVSVDLTTTVDAQMGQEVVELGEEVVITAERRGVKKDLTSSEARVDASQLQKLAVREVGEVLTLQAGVTSDAGGGIHIRGGRTSEVGYWVDGVSVTDVFDGSQAVQVDNNAIQELQVISGTFNAEYGQAMSGIVNIVTKDGGSDFHGAVSAYLGSYLTSDRLFYNLQKFRPLDTKNLEGSLSGPLGLPGVSFYFSGRYFKSNGYLYGNKLFYPDGTREAGVDSIKNSAGQFLGVTKPDNPVPMSARQRLSGQFKLTYQITGDTKFALTGVGSRIDFHDFNHDYLYNPDGDVNKFDRGYNLSGVLTQVISARTFYVLNLGFFKKDFKEYLYEDPLDSRYNMDPFAFSHNLSEFFHAGTNLHHFHRSTETRQVKLDVTSQVSRLHEVKIGLEGRFHRLYLEDYNVAPQATSTVVNGVTTTVYTPFVPAITSPLYQDYTEKPVELSGYIQDKLEYERMVVNIGIRFDYFRSNGKVLADAQDPNVYLPQKEENKGLSLGERMAKWYKKASAKSSISPRFGISYPITDQGILHFSYGHFLQIPSFEFLFQNPGFKVNSTDPLQGVYGNADLKPQRTTMYEFGLQQQLTDVLSFDVTGFYRDTRDWVSTSPKIPVRDPVSATVYYTQFVNKDYANSRGVTVTLNKRMSHLFSLNLSYTFQAAEGVNSSPDEEQGALTNNTEPTKTLTPLDWDQTHTVNLTLGIGENDWGIFLLGRYGSGLPYTPVVNQAEGKGEDAARVVSKNSRRRPAQTNLDLRVFKNLELGPLNMSVFVKVFNLLDTRNEEYVYGQTGRAFATPAQLGISDVAGTIDRYNTVQEYLQRSDFYSSPREIQFGFDINF